MPGIQDIPTASLVTGPCQRFSRVGHHRTRSKLTAEVKRVLGRQVESAPLWPRRGQGAARGALGTPSRFSPGEWVRVLDEHDLRATLDPAGTLRGLLFKDYQGYTCGRVYRVTGHVRRIIDDEGQLRLVSRTVLLEGLDCGGEHGLDGCGRFCPMMYRDEWLEPAPGGPSAAPEPDSPAPVEAQVRWARVRPVAEIERALDPLGRRGGLLFMPQMARYAGQRLPVEREIHRVWELQGYVGTSVPIYVLAGLHCTGEVLRKDAPCDRACRLLWHPDWLEFE